jgi:gp16 family phage-associated protein
METKKIKSPQQVKSDFEHFGKSIAEWCRENGVAPAAAYRVLRDPQSARRGECHRAAVLLGLKHGAIKATTK